jgi:hypothetical protein
VIEWRAAFRIKPRAGSAVTAGEPYPFDPSAARLAAWGPADPSAAATSEINLVLTEAIRSLPMARLLDPEGRSVPLAAAIQDARLVLGESLSAWGLDLLELRVGALQFDRDTRTILESVWRTRTLESAAPGGAAASSGAVEDAPVTVPMDWLHGNRVPGAEGSNNPLDPEPRSYLGAESHAVPGGETEDLPGAEIQGHGSDSTPPPRVSSRPSPRGASSEGRRTGAQAAANPVSFSNFLGSLRERSAAGDETAASVLRQLMNVMTRLDVAAAEPGRTESASASIRDDGPRQASLALPEEDPDGL